MNSQEKETSTHYGILNVERRRYPRFGVDLPIEYDRVGKPAGLPVRALDHGHGGLLIYFPERMEIGQRLRLRLFLSVGSELDRIELLSEVVWVEVRSGEDGGDSRTGVNILDISTEDRTKLNHFLVSL